MKQSVRLRQVLISPVSRSEGRFFRQPPQDNVVASRLTNLIARPSPLDINKTMWISAKLLLGTLGVLMVQADNIDDTLNSALNRLKIRGASVAFYNGVSFGRKFH